MYSPPGTGGVDAPSNVRKARTGWSFWTDHPVCAFKGASRYFLDAQPPFLFQEATTVRRLRQIVNGIDALRLQAEEKIPRAFTIELRIPRFDTEEKPIL